MTSPRILAVGTAALVALSGVAVAPAHAAPAAAKDAAVTLMPVPAPDATIPVGGKKSLDNKFLIVGNIDKSVQVKGAVTVSEGLSAGQPQCRIGKTWFLSWVDCTSEVSRTAAGEGRYTLTVSLSRGNVALDTESSSRKIVDGGTSNPKPSAPATSNTPVPTPSTTPSASAPAGKLALLPDMSPLLPAPVKLREPKDYSWVFRIEGADAARASVSMNVVADDGLAVTPGTCAVADGRKPYVRCDVQVTKNKAGIVSYTMNVTAKTDKESASASYVRRVQDPLK